MSRWFAYLVGVIVVAALVAGCGDGDDGDGGTSAASAPTETSTPDGTASAGAQEPAAALPQKLKDKGTLTVGTDPTFAPFEYKEGNTIKGIDADLAKAIATELGLEVELVQAPFDSLLPGLQTGKFDIGMSGFSGSEEREQVMNLVQYAQAGNSYFVNADVDPATVQKPDDLCGKRVAVLKGSANAEVDQEQAKKCDEKMEVLVFPDQNAEALAVASKRADVGDTFGPVAAWLVSRSEGKLQLAGENYDGARPIVIAVPKGTGLAQPVNDALKAVIADGTYERVMKEWNAESNMVDEPIINPVTGQPAD